MSPTRTSDRQPRTAEGSRRNSQATSTGADSHAPLTPSRSKPAGSSDEVESHPTEISDENKSSKCKRYAITTLWFLKDQWFLIGLACLVGLASQVNVPEAQQTIKEKVVTYLAVSLIFFITGCTLPTKALVDNYSKWKVHLFVQFQCFLMTSATTYGIVNAAATNRDFMDPWLLIGLIFAGSVPTTISSNVVMTDQAHGNTALTVVQSTLGNFLAPFLTPLLITMYISDGDWYTKVLPQESGGYGAIYRRVFMQLGLSLYLPMFIGQVTRNLFPAFVDKVFKQWKLSKISSLALLTIIWQAFDQAFDSGAFTSVKSSNIIFIVFISNALFILWLAICFLTAITWLPKRDVISVAYCVPAKTPAMGIPITVTMFVGLSHLDESKLQIPMVIYQAFQIVYGSILTIAFRRWIRPDEEREEADKAAAAESEVS